MMRATASMPRCMAVLVLAWFGLSSTSLAQDTQYRIIVHPSNAVTGVGRGFLRDAYLKKQTEWGHGEPLRPVNLSSKFTVHDQFTREVLQKTPAQLRSYWNQQIFSGKGVPPLEVNTTADVIAYVLANPGAIGYLPGDVDPGGARSIEVR